MIENVLDLLTSKGAYVFGALVVFFAAERLWPAVRQFNDWNRLARNFGLAFVNLLLGPLIVLPLTQFAAGFAYQIPTSWWSVALCLLLLDLWIYSWHRLNHVLPFLWRFHEIHHLDVALDATSALRFHFGEVLLSSLVRALFVILIGAPFSAVVLFEAMVAVAAIFHHSNLRLPGWLEIPLSRFIVTPRLHWVHHHALRRDTDSNYATILSFWDLLFKSRSPNSRSADMQIGVEGGRELGLLKLLLRPFFR